MAKIGLKGFWSGVYSETAEGITYADGKKVTKAVSANVTYNKSKAELYADNSKDDEVEAITSVDLSITPNDDMDEEWYKICGLTGGSMKAGSHSATSAYGIGVDTKGDYVGLGYIIEKTQSGVKKYVTYLYPKCKFYTPDSEEFETKGDNINFSTSAVTGSAYVDMKGMYVWKEMYETEAAAIDAMNEIFGIQAND